MPKQRSRRWGPLLIASLMALAGTSYLAFSVWQKAGSSKTGTSGLDQDETALRPSVGEFDLTDAAGKLTPFASYKGQVVILSFWASWCAPCLVELPQFAEIVRKFSDRGLKVVPINLDEGDKGQTFAEGLWKKQNFDFPSYFDAGHALASKFKVDTLPANFVIDRQGRVAFSGFGATDWNNPETLEFIEEILEEN